MVHGNEIEGHTQNIVRLALAGIVLVILATVLMGSVDVGTTSPNMRGEWNVHVNAQPTACNGSGRRRLDLYVDAEGILVKKPGATAGEGLRAGVNGNELFFEVTYTNQAGTETVERVDLTLQDGVMTGASTYTEFNGLTKCSASADVFATR